MPVRAEPMPWHQRRLQLSLGLLLTYGGHVFTLAAMQTLLQSALSP